LRNAAPTPVVISAKTGIQYAAAYRFNHRRLWNTGSPAFADDDSREHDFAISPLVFARSFVSSFRSLERGRRECRMLNAPAAWGTKKNNVHQQQQSPRVRRIHPAFPAQWFTAYFVLSPGEPGFLATVIGGMTSTDLYQISAIVTR
jgi:hypothetical protein